MSVQDLRELAPPPVPVAEHDPDESAGEQPMHAVVGFDLVGVAAAAVVDGFERQAVIPGCLLYTSPSPRDC
ncbi:hypothetical protein, partial [Mycobacterium colombiense]|uniref:hypothetical protein n=1 Tax=Mycobacterium colombiense TaxID=339268 RepID=UPI001E60A8EB